jgi:GDP-L-fucose synthase
LAGRESLDHLDLRSKSILITGGAGFLGSHIVERLQAMGCANLTIPRRAEFDLTRNEAVQALFDTVRPEVVIHAAAVVGGILANRDNPGRFFYENAMMGLQVVEACRVYGVQKAVILGTVCSYPKWTPVPFREDDLWAGYPEETNAPYGLAKKMLLTQCQAYRQEYGVNYVFLMPSNLYGPRDHFDLTGGHVIPALIRRFLEGREERASEIQLWGSGEPTRDFLFVDDAAEAVIAAAERYNGAAPVNIGSGQEISICSVAQQIAELVGFRGKVKLDATRPNGQMRRCIDVTRAEREFGFRAHTPLNRGLSATFEWYLQTRPSAVMGRDASSGHGNTR